MPAATTTQNRKEDKFINKIGRIFSFKRTTKRPEVTETVSEDERVITYEREEATEVFMANSADNWESRTPCVFVDGKYQVTLKVCGTESVQYKFIVDGEWVCDENVDITDDGEGNLNNVSF